jgi:diguanylate cyclase (GGDEF)-like protein
MDSMMNPHAPSAGRPSGRPAGSIAFAFGFLAAALLVFALIYGVYAWSSVYTEKMTELRNLTDLAARSSNMFFRRYGQVLPLLAEDLQEASAAERPAAARLLLARYQKAQPELARINLFDANANLLASSGSADPAAVSGFRADPAFNEGFKDALRRDGLVIGRAMYGVFVQDWIIPLRLRVLEPGTGRIAFVVSAVVRLDNQQALWRGLSLPPQAAIGLVRNDGFPLSRLPLPASPTEFYATQGQSAVWQYMSQRGFPDAGEVDGVGGVDHLPRVTTFQRLADYPVAAYLTVPRAAFWTAWRERVQVPFALFALALAGLVFAAAWTSRQQAARERERDAAEAALRSGAAELKRQTALLAQTQHAAHIGGWELNLSNNQLYWTEETYRILELSPAEFKPTIEQAIEFYAPESRGAIRSAVETAARIGDPWDLELELVTARGRRIWVRTTGTAELGPNGIPVRLSGAFQDVTDRRRTDDRIRRLAHYDDLTGLANRNLFGYHLSRALSHADRYGKSFSLLFIDLDRFKIINDSLGHDVGDSVLKIIGRRLSDAVRAADLVARFGGDEFVVIAEEVGAPEDSAEIARKLLAKIEEPVFAQGQEFILTASIGIAIFPADGRDMQTLVKHADIAMYRAKERGKNTFEFYTSGNDGVNVERLSLESRLKRAVSDMGQFVLHYQPKISVADGRITGVEALVRWVSPDRGMVPPAEFIPLAEETGLIGAIGEWVLESACRQSLAWHADGLPPVRIAVNISARQLYADHFVTQVHKVLADTGADPGSIELEITESVMMQNVQQMAERLAEMKQLGLHIAIDDFGTGYSSLSYLKRLPIDSLKVDRSFVQDVPADADDATITRAVIALAHSLRLEVVAEGVETEAQLEFLRDLGCDHIQGYLFSKPLPAAEVEELLRRGARLILPTVRDAA